MVVLPVFVFCIALLTTCLGSEHTTVASEFTTEKIACPGHCVSEDSCSLALSDVDCGEGLICCMDQEDSITSTEYAEYYTTEDPLGYSSVDSEEYEEIEAEVDEEPEHLITYARPEEADVDEKADYKYDYPEEEKISCPGECIPTVYARNCDYIITNENACTLVQSCCLTEEEFQAVSEGKNYYIVDDETSEDENVLHKRAAPPSDSCPGTCVHPSHALFCEQFLPEYSCPLDSKCCIKRSAERSTKVIQCTGQCLPLNIQGYCFPPNELIMGPTTCKSGTTCCMQKSSGSNVQPPSVGTMQLSSVQYQVPNSDPSQVVMGHLAIDDDGQVFRVGIDGQISLLPKLARINHLRARYNKLMVHPLNGGHIVVYSDSKGALYQQFYPNDTYDPETPFGRKPGRQGFEEFNVLLQDDKPTHKKLREEEHMEFQLDMFEDEPKFRQVHGSRKPKSTDDEMDFQDLESFSEELAEVIIPDDDDDAPVVVESKPSIADGKSGRPTCPGTCMSYFLRFTCFRGQAIYDGFSCPGRSVCCARLSDIESREQRLMSLSPYSKESSDSAKNVPKCGIKGRKDSQRSVDGKDSLPGEWCWQVAVINVQNQYMCGGALIGDSWVLTAAHCVASSMKENQAIFVRVGVTDLKSPEDNSKGQTIRVVSTLIHHNFKSINLDNNVALLKLQKPVVLNDNVCVVCLPTSGQMPAGNAKCTVTGYGFVSKEGEMFLRIREAQVPIVDDTDCMANVTEALVNPFILPASSFCAGGEGQQDACQGDAGGPLVCEIAGHHELVGLVSWTLGCGRNDVPGIYVKVPAFMWWINEVITSSSYLTALN